MFSKVFLSTLIAGALIMGSTPPANAQSVRSANDVFNFPLDTLWTQGNAYGVGAVGYGSTVQQANDDANRQATTRLHQLLLTKVFAPTRLRTIFSPGYPNNPGLTLAGAPVRGWFGWPSTGSSHSAQPTYVGGRWRVEVLLLVDRTIFTDEYIRNNAVMTPQ